MQSVTLKVSIQGGFLVSSPPAPGLLDCSSRPSEFNTGPQLKIWLLSVVPGCIIRSPWSTLINGD